MQRKCCTFNLMKSGTLQDEKTRARSQRYDEWTSKCQAQSDQIKSNRLFQATQVYIKSKKRGYRRSDRSTRFSALRMLYMMLLLCGSSLGTALSVAPRPSNVKLTVNENVKIVFRAYLRQVD